jgi:hypothetical protein
MLLSFHPCELQLKCTDPVSLLTQVSDSLSLSLAEVPNPSKTLAHFGVCFQECLKAHVSPQQADPKSSIKVNPAASKPSGPSMAPAGRGALPGGGTPTNGKSIPCRFGSQCTRADCVFSHPWIVNSAGGAERPNNEDIGTPAGAKNSFSAAAVPCKFGLQCSRRTSLTLFTQKSKRKIDLVDCSFFPADCFYQHPSSHRGPSKNISKSFINQQQQQQQQPTSKLSTDSSSGPSSSSLSAGGGLAGTEKLSPSKKFSAPVIKDPTSDNPPASPNTTKTNNTGQEAAVEAAVAQATLTEATQEPLVSPTVDDTNPTTTTTTSTAAAPSIQPAPSTPIPA